MKRKTQSFTNLVRPADNAIAPKSELEYDLIPGFYDVSPLHGMAEDIWPGEESERHDMRLGSAMSEDG